MRDHGISTHQLDDHIWVVAMSGDHDLADVAEVEQAIDAVFDAGSVLIVDLTEATLIDSTVMNAILYAQQFAASTRDHNMVVVAKRESQTRRTFEVGLNGYVKLYDDLPAAFNAIR